MAPKMPPPDPAMLALVSEKACIVRPLARPAMVPTTAIRAKGMSLIMVVETWNLPASRGDRALTT